MPMPLPPLKEQCQIAAVLSEVQSAMENEERLLALTVELKRTLLHQLVTAEIRVHGLDLSALKEVAQPTGAT